MDGLTISKILPGSYDGDVSVSFLDLIIFGVVSGSLVMSLRVFRAVIIVGIFLCFFLLFVPGFFRCF